MRDEAVPPPDPRLQNVAPVRARADLLQTDLALKPLPEGWQHVVGSVTLIHHGAWLSLECFAASRDGLRRRTANVRLLDLPVTDITTVEIENLTQQHARGFLLSTGFYGSGRQVAGTTGVLIMTSHGYLLLRFHGAPLAVKAQLQSLLRLVGS